MYILLNILCIIGLTLSHEMGHILVLKYYKIPFKLKTNIITTYVEIDEKDFCKIKNVKLYWLSGTISTIIISLILLLFPLNIKYALYGILMGVSNMFLIIPGLDSYKFFDLDRVINWNENNLHWKGLWALIGMIISLMSSIIIIWQILFRM